MKRGRRDGRYPHPGDHAAAEVYKKGVRAERAIAACGFLDAPDDRVRDIRRDRRCKPMALQAEQSFLLPGHPNVMVEAVKRAEDGGDLVIRLYETAGKHIQIQTTPRTGFDFGEAWLVDLMEDKLEHLAAEGRTIALAFTPFEIKSLRLAMQAR